MFADASALVAILLREPGSVDLVRRLATSTGTLTSPLALWETTAALTRGNAVTFEHADAEIRRLLHVHAIRIAPVTAEIGALAVDAFRRFGRGRHPAGLNFGDCFAYACARHHGVPLLFKGDDFPQTDIEAA